jgi:photosystem II stability/assembly factor-like uncharacterized protein
MKKIILILFAFLFFTQTSEAQWYVQQSGTTNPLYDIEFINRSTGWSCGDGGYIIKTTNGGENWIQQGAGVTFEPLFGIQAVDSNVVYAVGFFRTVVKTTNGGENWIKVESGMQGDGRYTCVFFMNSNTGCIGNFGPGYGVRRTTDGGQTINTIPFGGYPEDLYFKDDLNGVGVGGLSYIYRTTDGGLNWSSFSLVLNGDFYRVSFINENTGYTASTRAAYKTTNFGISWDSVGRVTPLNFDVTSIEFCNENTGWAGTQAPVYKTTNGGRDWIEQFVTGVVYSISAHNDSLVWTCGNGGRIWHTTNGGISFVNQISNEIPDDFSLYQNYPNPFNPGTIINFAIKSSSYIQVKIFDVQGRELASLNNKTLPSGNYDLKFDASGLNSGIYFYSLFADGVRMETKRMVYLK